MEGKREFFKTRVENAMRNVNQSSGIRAMSMEKCWMMMMDPTNKKYEE